MFPMSMPDEPRMNRTPAVWLSSAMNMMLPITNRRPPNTPMLLWIHLYLFTMNRNILKGIFFISVFITSMSFPAPSSQRYEGPGVHRHIRVRLEVLQPDPADGVVRVQTRCLESEA